MLFLVSVLLISSLSLSAIFAKEVGSQNNVNLGRGEIVDRDYFARGDTVTISGTVNGDVYAFGQRVIVDGLVNGDLIAVSAIVEILGNVSEDVRVGAGQVFIYGNIGGSLTAGSGNVLIDDNAIIGESIVIGAGSVIVDGRIGRGATIGAGELTLNSPLGGSVAAGVGQLIIGENASVDGDLNYWSDSEANIHPDAKITGKITRHISTDVGREIEKGRLPSIFEGLFKLAIFLSTLLLGLVLIRLAPVFTQDVVKTFIKRPLFSIVSGLLYTVAAPIVFLILFITVVGIPFALILLFASIILCMFIKIFVSIYIGEFIQKRFKLHKSMNMALLVGLIIYTVVTRIPIIGWLFTLVASLAAIGAVVKTKKSYWQKLNSKKII